jgi:ABC-type dipeptide/oligopeptide/nickel transport system ATPase component
VSWQPQPGDEDVVRAVDRVGFDIEVPELVGYLGPNGAGKSVSSVSRSVLLHAPAEDTAARRQTHAVVAMRRECHIAALHAEVGRQALG